MRKKNLIILLTFIGITFFLWDSFIIYPFKLFVVLIHELSHALSALATGGKVISIKISPNESGVAITSGGIRFIVLNAGYLGSALFGALLLYLSSYKKIRNLLLELMGIFLILVTIFFVRDIFTLIYCIIFSIGLITIGIKTNERFELYFLQFLGITSSLYALFDIRSDILRVSPNPLSDASKLAEFTHIPAFIWGGIWLAISLFLIYKVIFRSS